MSIFAKLVSFAFLAPALIGGDKPTGRAKAYSRRKKPARKATGASRKSAPNTTTES